jgi:hypothetical protein
MPGRCVTSATQFSPTPELQKDWAGRLRPDVNDHLLPVANLSFPSGRDANATLVWLCLALMLPSSA